MDGVVNGPTPRKIFLETSVQIARFLGSPERQARIRANLAHKKLYSSTYVFMEFQRTLLKDFLYVRSVIETDCPDGEDVKGFLGALLRTLAERRGEHTGRHVDRAMLAVSIILDDLNREKDEQFYKAKLIQVVDHDINALRENFFEVDLAIENGSVVKVSCSNTTDCNLIKEDLPELDTRRFHCRRELATCQLPSLLERSRSALERVRAAFGEQTKPGAALHDVLDRDPVDWNLAKGERHCWPLGDTIIALEAPEDAEIYSLDHHFETVCPATGRKRYREHSHVS